MAEPVNTLTNLVIIAAAIASFLLVRRQTGRYPPDLMLLVFLLFATGIGSFFWHALRTRTWLTLDWVPGVLFLSSFVFLWLRTLHGALAGAGAVTLVLGTGIGTMAFASLHLGAPPRSPLLFAPFFVALLSIGAGFVYLTTRARGPAAAAMAATLLGLAAVGALFRTADQMACALIPFGTHFLWHISLSAAAYCCIRFLTALKSGEHARPILRDAASGGSSG
jgi:hypothetical protein